MQQVVHCRYVTDIRRVGTDRVTLSRAVFTGNKSTKHVVLQRAVRLIEEVDQPLWNSDFLGHARGVDDDACRNTERQSNVVKAHVEIHIQISCKATGIDHDHAQRADVQKWSSPGWNTDIRTDAQIG